MNWSGGKDSVFALFQLLQGDSIPDLLVTTVNEEHQRISMHGVRRELLENQAEAIGIPLNVFLMPDMPTMDAYNEMMQREVGKLVDQGYTTACFGDIFLEDLKDYRDKQLATMGLKGMYPIWKRDTAQMVRDFVDQGFRTVLCCVDDRYLDQSWVGREIDHAFIDELPSNVDPCGENGEFHSFVFDGPIFDHEVKFTIGEKVHKKYESKTKSDNDCGNGDRDPFDSGFWYVDLLPGGDKSVGD